jgi:hypothetical protein
VRSVGVLKINSERDIRGNTPERRVGTLPPEKIKHRWEVGRSRSGWIKTAGDGTAGGRENYCRSRKSSSEMAGKYNPRGSRVHQSPVARRSAKVVNE